MREIKLRAWDEKYKIMTRSVSLLDISKGFLKATGSVIMQYTGLKDKMGKEIYEGDIIVVKSKHPFKMYGDDENPYEVKWDGCCYSFSDQKTLFHFCKDPYVCEVVGNIYENPELITNQN